MLRRTPLKVKMPLKAKTPMKKYSTLRAKTPLRAKSPMRDWTAKAQSSDAKDVATNDTLKQQKPKRPRRTTPNYVSDMDKVFQYYIRLRDVMPGGYGRCISCGKIKPFNHLQAGHFFSRKHFSTRWHEDNVNAECEYCNCWNGEHLLTYKENLVKKIGTQRFQLLEIENHKSRKWSDFEIKAMIKHYSQKILQLASSKGLPISQEVQRLIKKYQKISL